MSADGHPKPSLPTPAELDQVMLADRQRLVRQLESLTKATQPDPRRVADLARDFAASRDRVQHRRSTQAQPKYPSDLPITAWKERLSEAITGNQVVVVAGETGSGKTTQLPKILLELGLGTRGMIGCTQPRRIAARSVATRVAEELAVSLGDEVGYQVRFADHSGDNTRVKFMTDGILLAESRSDPDFCRYDALIIDEAHERSLNIDFLLGYLHRLLPRRPELKLVITSATIDTDRFSQHFGNAPVIEVSGRGYPVELRYRPLDSSDEDDQAVNLNQAIAMAIDELSQIDPRGDVLVFLSGEREIREAADYLQRRSFRHSEILPLYGRLTPKEQARVFHPGGQRRIILATNVAETSLTVPGIRFVIDSGRARISRYSHRSKIQRLPIEAISKASADQRAGRCGRLGPGTCIRLFSEQDYELREAFTEPEVLRTSLAAVILQMLDLGLGEISEFPFLEPPPPRMVSDGYRVLQELGALDEDRRITKLGRRLAHLPMDVRLGRILLAGEQFDCLEEVLTITSVLSIQDPRLRPLEAQQAADQAHAEFADKQSDFVTLLNLYREAEAAREAKSAGAFRRWCNKQFLSWLRLREWRDTRRQLSKMCKGLRLRGNAAAAAYSNLHCALLAGLPSHLGNRDEKQWYAGARGRRFLLHPGSGLYDKPPAWVVCAEIVETSKVYGRILAMVEPGWAELAAAHLLRRSYGDPHWSKRSGRVVASMQVSLYGLILSSGKRVSYASVDPAAAHEIFVRSALVDDQLGAKVAFADHNRQLVATVHALEARRRSRDLLVDESVRGDFFSQQIPANLSTRKGFLRWYQNAAKENPEVLQYPEDFLLNQVSLAGLNQAYPESLQLGEIPIHLDYLFEPGHAADGVSMQIPIEHLNGLTQAWLDHAIPGLIREQVEQLLRALPKSKRRRLLPIPDTAEQATASIIGRSEPLVPLLIEFLAVSFELTVSAQELDQEQLADHLRPRLQVLGQDGRVIAVGRDLGRLQKAHADRSTQAFLRLAGDDLVKQNILRWDFGTLPERVPVTDHAHAYPALVDQGDGVEIRLFDNQDEADQHMVDGLMRLILMGNKQLQRAAYRQLPLTGQTFLQYASIDSRQQLCDDLVYSALHSLICECERWPQDAGQFEQLAIRVRQSLLAACQQIGHAVAEAIAAAWPVARQLAGDLEQRFPDVFDDLGSQYDHLIFAGFARHLELDRLSELPRYFKAMEIRLQRMELDPESDQSRMLTVRPYWQTYLEQAQVHWGDPELERLHWEIEELRVSLFAQQLKTAIKVSPKRIERTIEQLRLDPHD